MIKRFFSPIFFYLLGLFVLLSLTFYIGTGLSHQNLLALAKQDAENFGQYINNELSRYQHIPQLLTSHYLIRQGLTAEEQDKKELNHLLLDITKTSGANDVYVMDSSGIVVATSNYGTERNFINQDLSFRPYFYQALAGKNTAYYALGARSGDRGIYFSAPIYIDKKVQGVVAVKVAIAKFEQDSELLAGDSKERFFVYGADNVVFLSNFPGWRLKQLVASDGISWSRIQASKRYLDLEQELLPNKQFRHSLHNSKLWSIRQGSQADGDYFYSSAAIPLLDLTLVMLLPDKNLVYNQLGNMALVGLLYLFIVTLAVYVYRRIAGYKQLLYTRDALEREVALRSKELANTQDALIKAAKLATIGQLSASINHEINQPLSAINTYLVSSRRMLDKGMLAETKANLLTIESLVNRVHKIVAQLKQFSKAKGTGLQTCSLQLSLRNALTIVGPQINSQGVNLRLDDVEAQVLAEPLKFEQVLVNLLSNAVDAMNAVEQKTLSIITEVSADMVTINISDTGRGLDLQSIHTIFEPFYTTKSDNGLGLGLSISRNIIHSFDGELEAKNAEYGGAIFTIKLKKGSV